MKFTSSSPWSLYLARVLSSRINEMIKKKTMPPTTSASTPDLVPKSHSKNCATWSIEFLSAEVVLTGHCGPTQAHPVKYILGTVRTVLGTVHTGAGRVTGSSVNEPTIERTQMLDIKFVRENPDVVDKACESRQNAHWDRERFFELDEARRSTIGEVERLQAERNAKSKLIGKLMREGKKDEAERAKAEVAANKGRIAELDERRASLDGELSDLVSAIPNIPHESVPYGRDDSDNPELRRWGEPREFDFTPKAHWDLGTATGMIDFDRGVKLAGTRFYLLGGVGALMERALINFFIDQHAQAGFKEWWPPVITNRESLFGTGQLPKFDEDLFHVSGGMYLIPTAE